MPVEIRELHIKAVVGTEPGPEDGAARASGSNGADAEQERETLIALCVERVLEILEQREER